MAKKTRNSKGKKLKEKKPLDPGNVCKCGASGLPLHKCSLAGVIPPFDESYKPCNCCGKCWRKCYDEV